MPKLLIPLSAAVVLLSVLLGGKLWLDAIGLSGPAGGTGVVEGTTVVVSSRVGGRVATMPAEEGQSVAAGDVLLTLDCVEPKAILGEAEAKLDAARRQAEAADRAAGAARAAVGASASASKAVGAQVEALRTQGDAAQRQSGRLDRIEGDVSFAQRDQAQSAAQGLAAQVRAAEAQHRASSAQTSAASQQASAAEAQAAAALEAVAAGEAAIARARLAVDECTVTAPRGGVVQLLPYELGELVGPGATLATVVDLAKVEAKFYLPNAELAAATPRGAATVRADAWPDRTFEGTVVRVATSPEFTPRNIQTRTDRDRLVYEVSVEVANADGALRPGMPVEVELAEVAP